MYLVEHYTSDGETFAGNDGETERIYHVFEAPSAVAARQFIRLNVPGIDPETGLVRKTITTANKGAGIYECKLKYSKIDNKMSVSIDCTPERAKITKSRRSVASFKVRGLEEIILILDDAISATDTEIDFVDVGDLPDNINFPFVLLIDDEQVLITGREDDDLPERLTAVRGHAETTPAAHSGAANAVLLMPGPDFGGLINVDGSKVAGVDWYVKSMKFSVKWSSKWNSLRSDYVSAVENLEGCVNDSAIAITIRGQEYVFQKGEVVSLGGTFDEGSDDGASISLKFEVSRNSEVTIGERDGTNDTYRSTISKRGWDVGWIATAKLVSNSGAQVDVPNSFHVDEIAEYADFGQFEIFDMLREEEIDREEQLAEEEETQMAGDEE